MVPAGERLPARPEHREVLLAREHDLGQPPVAVAEVGAVHVAVVQAEALFAVPDRPVCVRFKGERRARARRSTRSDGVDLVSTW